jgi:hypothetical protein
VHAQIEVVVVAPNAERPALQAPDMEGFWGYQVVEVGDFGTGARARAAGIVRARAPLVALAEEHAFPAAGWAEALIVAHERECAAVGPTVLNANPSSLVSWAALFLSYGHWINQATASPQDDLPGHNSSYKRSALRVLEPRLAELLNPERLLHQELRAAGGQLYLEPRAAIAHLNPSRLAPALRIQLLAGRAFGAQRASREGWSVLRRALYVLGGPLIPARHLPRIVAEIRVAGMADARLPRILPILLMLLYAYALGEVTGYIAGAGDSARELLSFEFDRPQALTRRDRRLLAP